MSEKVGPDLRQQPGPKRKGENRDALTLVDPTHKNNGKKTRRVPAPLTRQYFYGGFFYGFSKNSREKAPAQWQQLI